MEISVKNMKVDIGLQRQHENCFFLRFTNLIHSEFGKFYNLIWEMANLKEFET